MTRALKAWNRGVLAAAGLTPTDLRAHLEKVPQRIQYVMDCTARQIKALHVTVAFFYEGVQQGGAAMCAGDLINRLLGMPGDNERARIEADDRSAGYPLRRFAEFGILPGYEFPTEPASLRLLGDSHEDEPVTVMRRFGIGQFQPEATVYARSRRWKVIGLDNSSPWNPKVEQPSWNYRVCSACTLRYNADEPRCPRCLNAAPGFGLPSYEFAGFIAARNESPILDEEERYAERNLVRTYPQWDGRVTDRWAIGNGWSLRLSQDEEVRWLNEGKTPSPRDLEQGVPTLHPQNKGYLLCPNCGHILTAPSSNGRLEGADREQTEIRARRMTLVTPPTARSAERPRGLSRSQPRGRRKSSA